MGFLNISISTSGLNTAQKALQVTQNNIANINTPGYAREKLVIKESGASGKYGIEAEMGTGSIASTVQRIIDEYLVRQSRQTQSDVDYYNEMTSTLSRVESLYNEGTEPSISNSISKFYDAFEEASKYPEDLTYRNALIGEATKLVDSIRMVSDEVSKMKTDLDVSIQTQVSKINELTSKIADINKKISQTTTASPNTYLDQRDAYLDQLSALVDIEIVHGERGIVDVQTKGVNLVSGSKSQPVNAMFDQGSDHWIIASGSVEVRSVKGALAADLALRNDMIPGYEKELNLVTSTIITQVNNIHAAGYGLDNSTGNLFFTGNDATSMRINNAIIANPNQIALASIPGAPGNADNAKLFADLRSSKVMNGGTASITDYYAMFVFNMSHDLSQAQDNWTTKNAMLVSVNEQRQNVQGVNIDEEMSRLLEYQRFYQGNAKMLSTINQTFDTLMQMIN